MTAEIFLNVPFAEKDAAKGLGARWHRQQRQWYVPAGRDPAPFARWLPTGASELATPADDPTPDDERPSWSLRELIQRIQRVVQPAFASPVWVRAEIASADFNKALGHVYLVLVERIDKGEIARISAVLWRSTAQTLLTRFQRQTGGHLTAGLKVLVQAQVEVQECRGLRLRILDLDPRYTLGEMAVKLRAIREALRRDGLFERNRQLPFPTDFFQVAVISPEGAAGLGDFQAEADRLERAGLCRFHYFPAVFQGPAAQASLGAALAQATAWPGIDAVVILRGGGPVADLHWLNEEALARAVCMSPVPVLTGIGHEKDQTVLDDVACRALGTPSKVIHCIESTIQARTQQAEAAFQAILATARRAMEQASQTVVRAQRDIGDHAARQCTAAERAVSQAYWTVVEDSRRQLLIAQHTLQGHHQHLLRDTGQALARAERDLAAAYQATLDMARGQWRQAQQRLAERWGSLAAHARAGMALRAREIAWLRAALPPEADALLQRAHRSTEQCIGEILGLGPERTLKRGFALVRAHGRPVTARAIAQTHPHLDLEFHDGHLTVQPERTHDDFES
ncbi:MAG TPA: exodeoxyribonuclease VII large subunit [Candidatus Competibacteraceae bacterium]|nr:exodeoxyribonuclease VII large subunit [Candidatus Competibacteraceae bacterium]HRX70591.1 exodeoxyribonuclease VII large subunit [Candidatus Competibacteraceae bacterium]